MVSRKSSLADALCDPRHAGTPSLATPTTVADRKNAAELDAAPGNWPQAWNVAGADSGGERAAVMSIIIEGQAQRHHLEVNLRTVIM